MTLMEILKQLLGSNLDQEIETKEDKEKEKSEANSEISETVEIESSKEEVETNANENSEISEIKNNKDLEDSLKMNIFENGWFNSETGKIDENKIKNAEVLGAIQQIQARYKQEKDSRLISDKLNDELKNYSLNVTEDTLRKVLNLNNIKIDKNGEVTGVKEAIEELKTYEPGFFKDKEKESNPLNEGFNPVEKKNTESVNSFSQAFKLMEEITN